ncbi:MAG: 3-oxoacyl-[acyl-carrier-protein] reductase [Candidatus Aminicenantes bacterium]|nr:3-oxoacyl-[acyl-carrier-protein] reductase [Candidatus Aminicenantes bacterium]MDH5714159.1 3-oxoacyl-[acyl-carrier-protein] reductase [Candidatus Aminicenantes bacterium]
MTLEGRISLITGAAQGIGKEIALELARAGSDIAVADILFDKAEETVREIETLKRRAKAYGMDVSDTDEVHQTVNQINEDFGKIDILVNNAGITRDSLLIRMKREDWDKVLSINLTGVFNCTQAVLRWMLKQRYGRIVNIASVVGLMGNAGQSNYAASKAAIIGFSKSIAREIASRGITVNVIAPGYIDTPMTQRLPDEVKKGFLNQIPIPRLGLPQDIAKGVAFLVSDDAEYITGQVLNINGGMYM